MEMKQTKYHLLTQKILTIRIKFKINASAWRNNHVLNIVNLAILCYNIQHIAYRTSTAVTSHLINVSSILSHNTPG